MSTAPTKAPHAGGRPTELDQVCRYTEDGQPVTAGEQVIDRARLGLAYETCADSAGVSRLTLHKWRLAGGRLRATEARNKRPLTASESLLVQFVNDLERAEAEWEAGQRAIIHRAAEGGFVTTKTTTKRDAEGNVIETTTVTETLAPQWTAAAWGLERRKPDRYAKRFYSEITGKDGAPLVPQEDQARNLADELRAFQIGIAAEKDNARKVPAKG